VQLDYRYRKNLNYCQTTCCWCIVGPSFLGKARNFLFPPVSEGGKAGFFLCFWPTLQKRESLTTSTLSNHSKFYGIAQLVVCVEGPFKRQRETLFLQYSCLVAILDYSSTCENRYDMIATILDGQNQKILNLSGIAGDLGQQDKGI